MEDVIMKSFELNSIHTNKCRFQVYDGEKAEWVAYKIACKNEFVKENWMLFMFIVPTTI